MIRKTNFFCVLFLLSLCSCKEYFKNDFQENSPTSGKLNVYFDEGLNSHVTELTKVFEANYPNAHIYLNKVNDDQAIQALLNDSCKAIIVSRPLNVQEEKAFKSKKIVADLSIVAINGMALIANQSLPIKSLSHEIIVNLLTKDNTIIDSLGKELKLTIVFDKNNSSVLHYIKDSIIKNQAFAKHCNTLSNTNEALEYVSKTPNALAFIDFAGFSDSDDTLNRYYTNKIKFMPVKKVGSDTAYFPNQSSFLLKQYPYIRKIYVYKTAAEFSLSKGFQTFIAGPKGQHIFLKAGLMPTKQQERSIQVKLN
jgi:phosphate transport system substrate-binding protein